MIKHVKALSILYLLMNMVSFQGTLARVCVCVVVFFSVSLSSFSFLCGSQKMDDRIIHLQIIK